MQKPMNIQVLVAAMHQKDDSLTEKMNLQTDALIGNQCDRCSEDVYEKNGRTYVYFNRKDRGVGLNRNTTLFHASGDVLLFADEDMRFIEDYESVVRDAYRKIPKADAIIFNIETIGADMGRRQNSRMKRVRWYNALNYGAARLSVKLSGVRRENITFHTCFGGGTTYSSGEDSLFIADLLKSGLKVYVYPEAIASVDQTSSTWFSGYNKKYYYDKGAFFKCLSKRFGWLLCLQDLLRHRNYTQGGLHFGEALAQMRKGMKGIKNLRPFSE